MSNKRQSNFEFIRNTAAYVGAGALVVGVTLFGINIEKRSRTPEREAVERYAMEFIYPGASALPVVMPGAPGCLSDSPFFVGSDNKNENAIPSFDERIGVLTLTKDSDVLRLTGFGNEDAPLSPADTPSEAWLNKFACAHGPLIEIPAVK